MVQGTAKCRPALKSQHPGARVATVASCGYRATVSTWRSGEGANGGQLVATTVRQR